MDSVSVDNPKEQFYIDGEENGGSDELIEQTTNHQSKITCRKRRRDQDKADAEEQQVEVGSRVAVWWPDDECFYEGEVTRKRSGKKQFFIDYDDGTEEWLDFREHKFHLLPTRPGTDSRKDKAESLFHETVQMYKGQVGVGSRVAVWWEYYQKFYEGEVTRKRSGDKPFLVEYDDGDREWVNFRHRRFHLLNTNAEDCNLELHSDKSLEEPVKCSEQAMCELDVVNSNYDTSKRSPETESKSLSKMGSNGSSNEDERDVHGHSIVSEGDADCEKPRARGASSELLEETERERLEMKCARISSADGNVASHGGDERDSDTDGSIADDESSADDEKPFNPRARVPIKAILEDSDTSIPDDESIMDDKKPNNPLARVPNKAILEDSDIFIPDNESSMDDKKPNNLRAKAPIKSILEHSDTDTSIPDDDSNTDDEKPYYPRARASIKAILEDSESEDVNYPLPNSDDRLETHPQDKNDMNKHEVTRHELCPLCRTETMREPRATSCQHIFCQFCIKDHYKKDRTCPICRFPFGPRLRLAIEKGTEDAFRSVEQIGMTTGEVLHVYPSASAATMNLRKGRSARHVIDACQSKRKVDREFSGFYWRFQGSHDRVLRIDEAVRDGIPIEQVDLVSGKVIASFSSSRSAAAKTGVSRCSIRRVLDRRGKANAGGYFWRLTGEKRDPWEDPEPTNIKPVEKLCLDTGTILATFKSLCDAKKAMGLRMNSGCIRDTCDGRRMSAFGFFWRWSGSNSLPPKFSKLGKRVQLRKSRNGPVVKTFPNACFASAVFQVDFSTLCRWCRNGSKTRGFYWSYQSVPEIPEGEKLVSKRLRVHRSNGFWQEGRVQCFHAERGKHEIKYDSGDTELIDLDRATFEWKNDQGQKPIEKLSFESGKVLCTYSSVICAANELGVGPQRISAVILGRSKSCRGFFYRYQGSKALPSKRKGRKVVEQLCLKTGRVIAVHKTIKEAAAAIGITSPGISYCCNGRNGSVSAGGFGWRFAVAQPRP